MKETILKTIAAVLMLTTAASCNEHQEVIEFASLSTQAGSILCADGNAVSQKAYKDYMNAVGVIVKTGGPDDGYRFIAMALEDIGKYPYVTGENTDIYVNSGAGTDRMSFDGKENTAAMLAKEYEKVTETNISDGVSGQSYAVIKREALEYPAARAANEYSPQGVQGWHLPSSGELLEVFSHLQTIRSSMEVAGGEWVDTTLWYQSSTQDDASDDTTNRYNLAVSVSGTSKSTLKTEYAAVRPFITIK